MLTLSIMIALTVALWSLTSCSPSENTASMLTAPSESSKPNHGESGKGGPAKIADWTEAGVIHNACMDVLDDSLVNRPPSTFSSQEDAIEWTVNMLADHLIDELEYDSTDINPVRRYWLDEGLPTPTRTEFQASVETCLDSSWISTREYDYLDRLSYILFNSSWPETQVDDSLISFQVDVNTIGWNAGEEITIVPMMSIALYSNDWRHTGFDDSDPPEAFDIDWGSVWSADCDGGIIGAMLSGGNPAATLGSAGVSSAVMAIGWMILD